MCRWYEYNSVFGCAIEAAWFILVNCVTQLVTCVSKCNTNSTLRESISSLLFMFGSSRKDSNSLLTLLEYILPKYSANIDQSDAFHFRIEPHGMWRCRDVFLKWHFIQSGIHYRKLPRLISMHRGAQHLQHLYLQSSTCKIKHQSWVCVLINYLECISYENE